MEPRILNKDTMKAYASRERDNLILIDKPPDWTSFDIVKKIRNIGRFHKVGHAGTLDPFATGLLVLGTGNYTRRLKAVSDADKAYRGIIAFGEERDTYDLTGTTIHSTEIKSVDMNLIEQKVAELVGPSEQIPPMFSAKKVAGQRMYKLARKGVVVRRKPQPIFVHTFDITGFSATTINFYVVCSKGTYIRSLAHDIGSMSGYGAYLMALRRISIGEFTVENALTIDEFQHFWSTLN